MPDTNQLLPLRETVCCSATATYEPARPNGLQRLVHKVPGIRRLSPSNAGGQGFVPPRPLHDIRFALPPGASPVLMQQKRMDLKASVDVSGRVTRVELLFPRDEDLVTMAAYASNVWRFAPAESNGHPVPAEVILHFSFDSTSAAQAVIDKTKVR